MIIKYRDELGYVVENVDQYGVSFSDGMAYFNDKKIEIKYVEEIQGGNVNEMQMD